MSERGSASSVSRASGCGRRLLLDVTSRCWPSGPRPRRGGAASTGRAQASQGAARRPQRAAQPRAVPGPRPQPSSAAQRGGGQAGRARHGPRSLQGDQRHLGHAAGTGSCVEAARRLPTTLAARDSIARLGGDEFAVLLQDSDAAGVAAAVARTQRGVRGAVRARGRARRRSRPASASPSTPSRRPTSRTLLQRADVAMYVAKRDRHGLALVLTGCRRPSAPPALRSLLGELRRGHRRARAGAALPAQGGCSAVVASGVRLWCAGSTPPAGKSTRRVHRRRPGDEPDHAVLTTLVINEVLRQCRAVGHGGPHARGRRQRLHPQPARPRLARRSPRLLAKWDVAARAAASSRSPSRRSWPTCSGREASSSAWARWACGSASTTSAPATRRWATCGAYRSTS